MGHLTALAQFGEDRFVLRGIGEYRDVAVILRGRANHGGATHVNEVDRRVRREGVEVADHEVEGDDLVTLERVAVVGLIEVGQDRPVNARVQRLHPTVEHLGKSRHLFDLEVVDSRVTQRARRAARGYELDAQRAQGTRELHEPGLVPHA